MKLLRTSIIGAAAFILALSALADDGYRLWLRYDPIADGPLRAEYASAMTSIICSQDSPTMLAARDELSAGLNGLLDQDVPVAAEGEGGVLIGTPAGNSVIAELGLDEELKAAGAEGYVIKSLGSVIVVAANSDIGVLYGVFDFLRRVQTNTSINDLSVVSSPKITHRLLNHWDNLTRTVERGTAGFSLWEWFDLPDYVNPRYADYARACASVGINGSVLTNVNANATVLTEQFLVKVAALADAFRPYGVRVYLTARFSAPVEIGGLSTADPLDPAVQAWWTAKVSEIYEHVPDFGGFIVKANSEGQPGPQDYDRTHADGANMLADALAPHGGVVMWRAFVYSAEVPVDRAKQAYDEFVPLDGTFRENVFVQVKNGAIDFMPREPFHPLFGAMPNTALTLELQIAQEYLGSSTHLAFLAPMWEEVLDADTFADGPGSTVGRVVDGSIDGPKLSAFAGVANTGTNRNWTGHPLAAANWYAFGRLAWNHTLSSEQIAREWVRMTLSNDEKVVEPVVAMLLESHEAVVNYMTPLGLHHIMARGHHYGPGPWVSGGGRPDWTSVYYHRADEEGIGFDRSPSGSDATSQYAPEVAEIFADVDTCPEKFLLWFHHLPWDFEMKSGRTLWDEICIHYQRGVDQVRGWIILWDSIEGMIDQQRFDHVKALLTRQEREARWWRDACLLYFQTFSKRPLPQGVEPPAESLEFYMNLQLHHVPGYPGEQ